MIEEKNQEQTGGLPAAPPPLTTKDKLRAAWARLQCISLLRNHRIRIRPRHHVNGLTALICALPLARQLGDWLYALGFAGEYTLIRAGRSIRAAALWLAAAFLRGWNNVMDIAFPGARTVLRELFGPVYVFCRGVRNIWLYGDGVRREQGFWAGIVADAIRQSIQALPAEPDIAGAISYAQKTAPPITESAKQGLLDGLGVSPMQEDKGYINVKIGFDGYNDLKTKKYPKGQPNVMIARTLESGSSIAEKRPFVRPAGNRVRKQAEAKMAEVLDEGIKKSMEGAVE